MPEYVERPRKEESKKYRVQLDFSEEAFQALNDLQKKLGASSRAEVVRDGLTILQWMYDKSEQGYQIVALGRDPHVLEPVFNFLPRRPTAPGDTVLDRIIRVAQAATTGAHR